MKKIIYCKFFVDRFVVMDFELEEVLNDCLKKLKTFT